MIAFMGDENLGFVFQAAKCGGMDDAIAIALKRGTVRTGPFINQPTTAL
ncbi:hypothetical protein GCM10008927_07940 [Amylibacter ulvae]|uniref:Uncharacterized protein n=1 Tax=Paramylibacter ulvae TaxID=1651968 RepID=A0ABQ3CVK8_9RHOB|nr:hypothetical protein GCM10008927_07940 [Amylibacter ulvae]